LKHGIPMALNQKQILQMQSPSNFLYELKYEISNLDF